MTGPMDAKLVQARMQGQDLARRKMEMDSLRARLGDSRTREQRLREACEGFESIFVQKLWKQMRTNVPKEGYLHSKDEEFWQDMFDKELSQKMTKAGGIGLSDMLFEQLQSKLEGAGRATAPSRIVNPLPVKSLSSSPVKVQEPVAIDADLYTPVKEESPITPIQPIPRPEVPPEFSVEDRAVYEKVEQLANKLLSQAEKTPNFEPSIPQPASTPSDHMTDGSTQISTSGMGGPSLRSPDMGMLDWPLPGRITSGFGWRNSPFTGEREWHAGVDIAGNIGDPIAAAWDGKVVFAGEKEGYGNLVVLEHAGGWRSYYGHTSKMDVQEGDVVHSGNKIAEVGNTGRSTGPHLHFEIRQGELAWNPEQVRSRLMAGLTVGRKE